MKIEISEDIQNLIDQSSYANKAMDLFEQGYNCSQSSFLAFKDLIDIDEKTMKMMASSFGGGMGRLREMGGALSGIFMVAGILYGYDTANDDITKEEHYARIQELANKFKKETGSLICRELLGLDMEGADDPKPKKRTKEYYEERPCKQLVGLAVAIMHDYIKKYPVV